MILWQRLHTKTISIPSITRTLISCYKTVALNYFQCYCPFTHQRYSQFRVEHSLDEIKNSQVVSDPLTKLQCWYYSKNFMAASQAFVFSAIPFDFSPKVQRQMVLLRSFWPAKTLYASINSNRKPLKCWQLKWQRIFRVHLTIKTA